MRVLISMRVSASKHGLQNCLEQAYTEYYGSLGFELVPVPNDADSVKNFFNLSIDGIILTGGNNVCAERYGGNPQTDEVGSAQMDATNARLLECAIVRSIPVFAECRGAQFINVFFGGKLYNDSQENDSHVATYHKVHFIDELSFSFGKNAIVNSYHRQLIRVGDLSSALVAFAMSDDGTVEAFYHPKHRIVGVLWHPERDKEVQRKKNTIDPNKLLLEAFRERTLFWR